MKMLNIVIFGAPGSGKGTQSELLIEKYGLTHISTGDVLRTEIRKQSELGLKAEAYMSKGELVPDFVVIDILDNMIAANGNSKGFIFDGFPRTLPQGEALDKMLEKNKTSISVVLSMEVKDEELTDRLIKRGKISGRSDDNHETITSRLKVYYNHTEPLKEFYKEQGKLVNIEGTGSIEGIFSSITNVVDSLIV